MSARLKITLFTLLFITGLSMVYMEIKGRDSLHPVQIPWNYKIKKVTPALPSIAPIAKDESTIKDSTDPHEILKQEQEIYLESLGEAQRKEIELNRDEEIRRDKELADQRAAEFAKMRQMQVK